MSVPGPYATADDAAIAALNRINPVSIRENKEYCGLIFRSSAGGYGFTPARVGSEHGCSLDGVHLLPGAVEVGNYHCHGDYSHPDKINSQVSVRGTRQQEWLGAQSDVFGPNDLPAARSRARGQCGYRAYLGTPSGTYLFFDVDSNQQGKLAKRAPRVFGS